MNSPILFIVFNRPDTTERVFEAIRQAKPSRLYVAADGPRPSRPAEQCRCERVREIATKVDWPCEVKTLFQDSNLGCKRGVSTAINWFFENEEEGIVLEDDVLPIPSFFAYCDELLERYRDDPRIGVIAGNNPIAHRYKAPHSYFFSNYGHVWGWASWRRAWNTYDVSMAEWPSWIRGGGLAEVFPDSRLTRWHWTHSLSAVYRGEIDTWDAQWLFSCWKNRFLAAIPAFNQTENIGFGPEATHTTGSTPTDLLTSAAMPLAFPLSIPEEVRIDHRADRLMDRNTFKISPIHATVRLLKDMARQRLGSLFRTRNS